MRFPRLKAEIDTKGFFVLEFEDTGKVYTGTANKMYSEVVKIEADLANGVMKCRKLQKMYKLDTNIVARFFPAKTIPDARKAEKEFRSVRRDYLLIN